MQAMSDYMDPLCEAYKSVADALQQLGFDARGYEPVIAAIIAVLGTRFLFGTVNSLSKKLENRRKRVDKQNAHKEAMETFERSLRDKQVPPEKVAEITGLPMHELAKRLQEDKLTAAEVLHAYQIKAVEVNKKLNCLTDPVWEAEPQALDCDSSPKKKGPLHGVPISFKENYGIEGYDMTLGCAKFVNQPATEDSVLVKVVKKQGGIPFVRTTVPQTMMSFECSSPIFGQTLNPHDLKRQPGGSSGGEGALLAAGGSPCGFGSDIGGSIRIPANMCGIYGLKPSGGRLGNKGNHPSFKGQTVIPATLGPMARNVDDLVFIMRHLLIPYLFELDPSAAPVEFRSELYETTRPLTIGYYVQDGIFTAVPSQERGVLEAKAALEKLGHKLVPWKPPGDVVTNIKFYGSSVFGDGGEELTSCVENDKVDHAFGLLNFGLRLPNFMKRAVSYIAKFFIPVQAGVISTMTGASDVAGWWQHTKEVKDFRSEVMADWKANGLDAVICPGFGCNALPVGHAAFAIGAISYTATYNVLDFPAGSLPVTRVTAQDEAKLADYPLKDLWHSQVKKSMVGSTGLPVNLQVVTLPWQEELCLRVMKEVQDAVNYK